jgi:hypothetical protein
MSLILYDILTGIEVDRKPRHTLGGQQVKYGYNRLDFLFYPS